MIYPSIHTLAEELHCGMLSPTELVQQTFERIDLQDGEIQAFVTLMQAQALKDANQAEREMRSGLDRGPLHGIPIAIKDLIDVKGVKTTAGSKVLVDTMATEDATVVELLRKAGAIIIGKTNTYEFAYGPFAPPTRNPWDHTRTTGGSSGGSAAAVIAGMCPGSLGTDTGGSIRIPSACCGITGFKPTYGRVSCHGVIPLSWSLDHVGSMARSAEDCAIIFDAIAHYDPRDLHSISSTLVHRTATLLTREGENALSLQGLKFGVPQDSFVAPLDAEVRQAWRAALSVFQEEGVELIDVTLPRPTMELYRMIQRPEASLAHIQKGWFPAFQHLYTNIVRERLIQGQHISAIDYLEAQQERRNFTSNLRNMLQRVDAFVLPTLPIAALPAERVDQAVEIDGVTEQTATAFLRLTMPFNLAGLPAISFPCGFSADGLPLGLQIAGRPLEDATVLRIAHAYQQLTDWHRREIPSTHH